MFLRISLLLLILAAKPCRSQDFLEELKKRNQNYLDSLDKAYLGSSAGENLLLELKFWKSISDGGGTSLLYLTFSTDSIWSASYHSRRRNKEIRLSEKWSDRWKRLTQLGIGQLSGKYEALYEEIDENGDTALTGIVDGVSYRIEFNDWKGAVSYSYHCPRMRLEYEPENEEMKRFVEILDILHREFGGIGKNY
ncbi:MAG: hypothetical protein GC178_10610 [Flavobacteriales bacterium]|nr:hypothetical protein [Flavobacteriales bacterium]